MTTPDKRTKPTRDMRYRYCIIYRAAEKSCCKEQREKLTAQSAKFKVLSGSKAQISKFQGKTLYKIRETWFDGRVCCRGGSPPGWAAANIFYIRIRKCSALESPTRIQRRGIFDAPFFLFARGIWPHHCHPNANENEFMKKYGEPAQKKLVNRFDICYTNSIMSYRKGRYHTP